MMTKLLRKKFFVRNTFALSTSSDVFIKDENAFEAKKNPKNENMIAIINNVDSIYSPAYIIIIITMIYSFRFFLHVYAFDVLTKVIAEKGGIDRINKITKGALTCADSEVIYINMKITDYNADTYYMYRQG